MSTIETNRSADVGGVGGIATHLMSLVASWRETRMTRRELARLSDANRELEAIRKSAPPVVSVLAVASLGESGRHAVAGLIAEGLVEPRAAFAGTLILTLKGRLLADAVVRRVLPD